MFAKNPSSDRGNISGTKLQSLPKYAFEQVIFWFSLDSLVHYTEIQINLKLMEFDQVFQEFVPAVLSLMYLHSFRWPVMLCLHSIDQ